MTPYVNLMKIFPTFLNLSLGEKHLESCLKMSTGCGYTVQIHFSSLEPKKELRPDSVLGYSTGFSKTGLSILSCIKFQKFGSF